jgi:hypothetical protein
MAILWVNGMIIVSHQNYSLKFLMRKNKHGGGELSNDLRRPGGSSVHAAGSFEAATGHQAQDQGAHRQEEGRRQDPQRD